MAIVAIADPSDNILVPKPGFPLYTTLCNSYGIETRHYHLKMDEDGLIDTDHVASLIDLKTRAIIVNNPSNPTGIVFSKNNLEDVLKISKQYRVVK